MANLFFTLPVVANGVGAPVNISATGAEKSLLVQGPFSGTLTIEISENAGVTWSQIATFTAGDQKVFSFAAQLIRVRSEGVRPFAPFSVGVELSANNNGGLFATIPAPPKNGAGAQVNISTFGLFTTIVVGGTVTGAIGIQVSDDGVDWTEIATFNKTGNINFEINADLVRAVSRTTSGAPFAPVVSIGAINDTISAIVPSAGISNAFVYQPDGGGVGPAVFEDWDDLYAALVAARAAGGPFPGGAFTISFDSSFVSPLPAVVPAGTYDMDSVVWENAGDLNHRDGQVVPVMVRLAPAVFLPNLARISHLSVEATGPDSPIELVDGEFFTLDLFAELSSFDAAFFDGSAMGPGDTAVIYVNDGSTLGDGEAPVISAPVVGSIVELSLGENALVATDALDFAVGAVLRVVYGTVSSIVNDTQSLFFGTLTTILPSTWRYRNNGINVGPITISAQAGDIVRCTPAAGTVNVDLPEITLWNDGQTVAVKSVSAIDGTINIRRFAGDTIDGAAASLTLTLAHQQALLVANAATSNWDVIVPEPEAADANTDTFFFGNDSIAAAADTRFISPGHDQQIAILTDTIQLPVGRAGTMRRLYVRHNAGPGSANTVVYTMLINGVATTLTVTLAANAVAQVADLVHSAAVAVGDRISLQAVKALGITNGAVQVEASVGLDY